MRPHIFIAIAAAVGLSGCAPNGYSSSTAVADQFKQALGSRTHAGVSTVALCTIEGQKAVSVLFDGGEFYHYVLKEDKPELVERSTAAQRRNMGKAYYSSDAMGCLGYYSRDGFQSFVKTGAYRLEFDFGFVRAHVHNDVMYDRAFGDQTKARLVEAAGVVVDAVERQKTYVPVEKTWNP